MIKRLEKSTIAGELEALLFEFLSKQTFQFPTLNRQKKLSP
jgi:hypothetical protein